VSHDRLREIFAPSKIFKTNVIGYIKMNNSDKNTEPQINAQIIKCFKNLEPWELKKYEELSDYMIKTASESSQRLNF
jgi:hypothetical protein